jgi:hypothetical protein
MYGLCQGEWGQKKIPHTAKPKLSTKYIQTYVQEDVKEDVKIGDVNRGCKRLVNKLKQSVFNFWLSQT